MYFQDSSEWIVCFKTFDTRFMHFDGISNWSNCRSLFSEDHVTLVKLIIFVKQIFPAVVQIYLQMFFAWVLRFRAYDTCCPHFCQTSNWSNGRSLFWSHHVTLVKLFLFVKYVFTTIVEVFFQSISQ